MFTIPEEDIAKVKALRIKICDMFAQLCCTVFQYLGTNFVDPIAFLGPRASKTSEAFITMVFRLLTDWVCSKSLLHENVSLVKTE